MGRFQISDYDSRNRLFEIETPRYRLLWPSEDANQEIKLNLESFEDYIMILKRVAENAVVEEQDGILRISDCKVLDVPRVIRFMTVGAIPDSIISYAKRYCEVTTEDRHLFTIHDRYDRMGHFLRVRSYGKEKIGEDQELKTVWRMLELCGLMRVSTSFFEICRGRYDAGLRDDPYYASGSYNREWLL